MAVEGLVGSSRCPAMHFSYVSEATWVPPAWIEAAYGREIGSLQPDGGIHSQTEQFTTWNWLGTGDFVTTHLFERDRMRIPWCDPQDRCVHNQSRKSLASYNLYPFF